MLETFDALCCARDFFHAKSSLFVLAGTVVNTSGACSNLALFNGRCMISSISMIRIPQKLFDDRPAMTGKSIYFASDHRIFIKLCTVSFFQEGVVSALCNLQLVSVQLGDVAIVRKVISVDSSRCQANAGVSSLLARLQSVGRSFVGRLLPGENGQAERVILALGLALGFCRIQTLHAIRTIVSEVEKSVASWLARRIRHALLTQAGERVAKPASNFRLFPR